MKTIPLFRAVGTAELELIKKLQYREFPPRKPEQPIFYPVLSEEYAIQMARDWNADDEGVGYVTGFLVDAAFMGSYEVHQVGSHRP